MHPSVTSAFARAPHQTRHPADRFTPTGAPPLPRGVRACACPG
ncbi:hypothetical protein chiPu_0029579, partial [Chiloscyllium punctatum]|nr:hypothetical protein [Chiloscyllium punctatum]